MPAIAPKPARRPSGSFQYLSDRFQVSFVARGLRRGLASCSRRKLESELHLAALAPDQARSLAAAVPRAGLRFGARGPGLASLRKARERCPPTAHAALRALRRRTLRQPAAAVQR